LSGLLFKPLTYSFQIASTLSHSRSGMRIDTLVRFWSASIIGSPNI
jgi:hypothetical protein